MKTFKDFINENIKIDKSSSNQFNIIYDDNIIGYITLNKEPGSFYGKIWRYEQALEKHNVLINLSECVELAVIKIYKEYRLKGYAELSMKEIIKYVKSINKKCIILEASSSETNSKILINFYKKLGFIDISTKEGNYMIKKLI